MPMETLTVRMCVHPHASKTATCAFKIDNPKQGALYIMFDATNPSGLNNI